MKWAVKLKLWIPYRPTQEVTMVDERWVFTEPLFEYPLYWLRLGIQWPLLAQQISDANERTLDHFVRVRVGLARSRA